MAVAQVAAAMHVVFDLNKDLADLVFDGVGAAGTLLEAGQLREERVVDERAHVVAGDGGVVVELALSRLGRSPVVPAKGFRKDEGMAPALKCGLGAFVVFQRFQTLQEEQPT